MGGYIKRDVKRLPSVALNQQVNKEVLDSFKDYCKEMGYPMNTVLEPFMRQFTNGRFNLEEKDILKWKDNSDEKDTLNTTFNKEIYRSFKAMCKDNGYFVRHVITAFMEKISTKEFILEFVSVSDIENDKPKEEAKEVSNDDVENISMENTTDIKEDAANEKVENTETEMKEETGTETKQDKKEDVEEDNNRALRFEDLIFEE